MTDDDVAQLRFGWTAEDLKGIGLLGDEDEENTDDCNDSNEQPKEPT